MILLILITGLLIPKAKFQPATVSAKNSTGIWNMVRGQICCHTASSSDDTTVRTCG